MKGDQQGRRLTHSIKFMSINVGRGGTTQDITLARACELFFDVLLIQEPWWSGQTKTHPFFDCHIPFGGNGVRLNVYKEPHNPSAAQPLLNWTPPTCSVAAGDFNSVYSAWQPGVAHSYGQGEEIENWVEENNLSCLIIGEPTHRAGNTLDLVWTNINGANAWVEHDECMTSDHFPICGIIPSKTQGPKNDGPIKVQRDKYPDYAKVVAQWVPPLTTLSSMEDIENATEKLL